MRNLNYSMIHGKGIHKKHLETFNIKKGGAVMCNYDELDPVQKIIKPSTNRKALKPLFFKR